jgi:cysteine desulfurase/selenocysteine lyase
MTNALTPPELRRIRDDFPILSESVNGHPLVYLDSGATSHKPLPVLEAERYYNLHANAAVNRGAHTLAALATEAFDDARATVARFVGARTDEIVWTSNATEGINLIAYGLSNSSFAPEGMRSLALAPGDEILVTELDHHANLIPWQELGRRTGATLRFIPVDDFGALRLDLLDELLTERTRVLAVSHLSNVLGTVNPIELLVERAHAVGALVVLDACQSAPHLPLDLRALDVDFAVFSGHKMFAPTGIGVLYGRRELLAALPPVQTGGSMITTVTMQSAQYLPPPHRFEPGTQRVSQVIALAEAVRYLERIGMPRIADHSRALGRRLVAGLAGIDGIRLLGDSVDPSRIGITSFEVDGVHAHDVGQFLDDRGIAVRVGHHCAQPLHRRLGLTASTRASASVYTTDEEIDFFLASLAEVRPFFGVNA